MKDASYCPYCMAPLTNCERCTSCGEAPHDYSPLIHHLIPYTVLSGRYLVGRALGEGGFGITYIGRDLKADTPVAIKEYFPKTLVTRMAASSPDVVAYDETSAEALGRGRERFLFEAHALSVLNGDPVAVSVLDSFEQHGTSYIVMEYVQGQTLLDLCRTTGKPLEAQGLLRTIEPTFTTLATLHQAGLIHRDISPDNLMIASGRIRLIDFGCAREGVRGTRIITVMLKDGYSPIEQYTSRGQGPWTDVYGMCATIYRAITGVLPPSALERQVKDELVGPRELGCDLTAAQEAAILKGLRVKPSGRYQSMEALHDALYGDVGDATD